MKQYLYLNPEDGTCHQSSTEPTEEQIAQTEDGSLDIFSSDGANFWRFDSDGAENSVDRK